MVFFTPVCAAAASMSRGKTRVAVVSDMWIGGEAGADDHDDDHHGSRLQAAVMRNERCLRKI
jgi:hypothetical protein